MKLKQGKYNLSVHEFAFRNPEGIPKLIKIRPSEIIEAENKRVVVRREEGIVIEEVGGSLDIKLKEEGM